jgi:hypothetical protein
MSRRREKGVFVKQFDFFRTVNAPYYIFNFDYCQSSAGVRVLHYLCHALNELGEEAYILASVTSPYLRTPRLTEEVMMRHAQAGRLPIAVYPEVIHGNPMEAPVVARWLLNKPGHLGGDAVYDQNEILFAYLGIYAPEGDFSHLLYIPGTDGHIFHNRDNPADRKRQGACFYAHKYLRFGEELTSHATGATSLCQDIPRSHEEIAEILRRSEVLYCYEPSAIITEALYCGCPVVIIPSNYLEQLYDYEKMQEPGVEIGYDEHALERAQKSLSKQNADAHIDFAKSTLLNFIDVTQKKMHDHISEHSPEW